MGISCYLCLWGWRIFFLIGGGEGGEVKWFFFMGKGGESVVAAEYKGGAQKIDCLLMASQGRGGGDGVI